MFDVFQFPRVSGGNAEEKITAIIDYLIQFKETLEFALMNISYDNLSPELINKLNELGAGIENSNETREDEVAQVSANALTVSDVCNSDSFKDAIKAEASLFVSFNVNFNTGHLEYAIKEDENNG